MFLCLGLAINWVVEALRPVTRLLQLVPTATGSKSSLLRSVSSLLLGGSSSSSGSKSQSSSGSSVFPLSWLFSSNDVSKQAQEIVRGVNAAAARNGFSPSSVEVQVQEMNQYESLSGMGNTQQAMRKSIVVGYMDVDLYASVRGRRGPSGAGLQRDIWSRD